MRYVFISKAVKKKLKCQFILTSNALIVRNSIDISNKTLVTPLVENEVNGVGVMMQKLQAAGNE